MILAPLSHPTAIQWVAMAATSLDPVAFFINYGVAGMFLALFVTGRVSTKAEVDRLERRIDELVGTLQAKDSALTRIMEVVGAVLPQLGRTAEIVEALPKAPEKELLDRLTELASKIEGIEGRTKP